MNGLAPSSGLPLAEWLYEERGEPALDPEPLGEPARPSSGYAGITGARASGGGLSGGSPAAPRGAPVLVLPVLDDAESDAGGDSVDFFLSVRARAVDVRREPGERWIR